MYSKFSFLNQVIYANMAMSIVGSIQEFDKSKESIIEYLERFESFLEANGITDAGKQRAVFLASVGPVTYKLIRSLANNAPKSKTYAEPKALLQEHMEPKPNIIAQRYKFFKRDRAQTESVSDYVAVLRDLSEHCEFGTDLDEHLRDRIVCGINIEKILQKLLSQKRLTLADAIDNAIAIEAAMKNTREIQIRAGNSSEVKRVDVSKEKDPKEKEKLWL